MASVAVGFVGVVVFRRTHQRGLPLHLAQTGIVLALVLLSGGGSGDFGRVGLVESG